MICDNESFRRAVRASQSPADLLWRLAQARISHLLVRLDLFNQWADNQFQTREKQLLKTFFGEKLLRLYQGHGYALFAVTAGSPREVSEKFLGLKRSFHYNERN